MNPIRKETEKEKQLISSFSVERGETENDERPCKRQCAAIIVEGPGVGRLTSGEIERRICKIVNTFNDAAYMVQQIRNACSALYCAVIAQTPVSIVTTEDDV